MGEYAIRVMAHNVRSLWNVGSIFRSCDGFGVEMLYLSGYTGAPPRKEITKTALGAEDSVPWERSADPLQTLLDLKELGWSVICLEQTENSIPLPAFRPTAPLCLIVGNEIEGVREDIIAASTAIVEIPMRGKKESFNVAVSLGIALYALRFS